MDNPGYAVLGVYWAGSKSPSLLAVGGKVVIFDTPEVAKQFLPRLGGGRLCHESADGETAAFSPIDREGVNRAEVLTGYDPYDAPMGLHIPGEEGGVNKIHSESRRQEWRHHIIWSQAFASQGAA